MLRLTNAVLLISLAALGSASANAAQRTFVASYGSDANVANSCALSAPCRSFAAALTASDSGGEIVALDSAGYGTVTIDRSITLAAAPGVFAGISVADGATGVTIATAGVNVTLRGLTIQGGGGGTTLFPTFGVSMTNGSSLTIENSHFARLGAFQQGSGVLVNAAARVRIVDSLIRNSWHGVAVRGGAKALIVNTRLLENTAAGLLVENVDGATTTASIMDSVVADGDTVGIDASSKTAAGTARISVIRSTIANNNFVGVLAETRNGGQSLVTISQSMVTGNGTGLGTIGAGAVVETLGNNTVRQSETNNTGGTITPVSPM